MLFNDSMAGFDTEKINYGFTGCGTFIKGAIKLAYIKNMTSDNLADFLLVRTYLKTCSTLLDEDSLLAIRNAMNNNNLIYKSNDEECNERAQSILSIFQVKNIQHVKK